MNVPFEIPHPRGQLEERRKLDELLSRHRRLAAMGEMAAALAHQIRTPLSAGLLYLDNARRADLPAAQRAGLLERATACLHDLERLIADMLHFARGAALVENRFSTNELLDAVEQSVLPVVQAEQSLTIERSARDAILTGSRDALAGALLNLAMNALQAAGPRGRVRVVTNTTALQTEIAVMDDGPGIAEPLRSRIFEPFFTSRPDGTGLGLSVALSVARAHKGDLVLTSAAPGSTTFSLRLPVIPAARAISHDRDAAA